MQQPIICFHRRRKPRLREQGSHSSLTAGRHRRGSIARSVPHATPGSPFPQLLVTAFRSFMISLPLDFGSLFPVRTSASMLTIFSASTPRLAISAGFWFQHPHPLSLLQQTCAEHRLHPAMCWYKKLWPQRWARQKSLPPHGAYRLSGDGAEPV